MIQAQLELYLTSPGRMQFSAWFAELAHILSASTGFINAQLLEVEGALTPRVVLIYDNRANLEYALKSAEFAKVMARMQPYLLQQLAVNFCKAINYIQYSNSLCTDASMQWPNIERRRSSQ